VAEPFGAVHGLCFVERACFRVCKKDEKGYGGVRDRIRRLPSISKLVDSNLKDGVADSRESNYVASIWLVQHLKTLG
jgi:hypothetical protein